MHYDPSLQKFEKQTSGFVLFAASVLLPRGFYRGMTNDRKKRTAEKKEKKKRIVQYFYAATPVDNTSTHVRVCNCAVLEHKLQKMKQFVHSTLAPLVRQEKVTDGL